MYGKPAVLHFFTLAAEEQLRVPVILHPFFRQAVRLPAHSSAPEHAPELLLEHMKHVAAETMDGSVTTIIRAMATVTNRVLMDRFIFEFLSCVVNERFVP